MKKAAIQKRLRILAQTQRVYPTETSQIVPMDWPREVAMVIQRAVETIVESSALSLEFVRDIIGEGWSK